MKTLMIVFNQSIGEMVMYILNECSIRGYTRWEDVQGCGSYKGEPHLGTHAWPAKNSAIMCVLEQEQLNAVLPKLKMLADEADQQGMRAFVWDAVSVI